ncbi:MAG: DUF3786 domain-containing protein [Deferrisomatales bacterium]
MANADPEDNRLYSRAEDLHPRHWESLVRRDPSEAARAAGATWEAGAYRLPVLGRVLRVDPGARSLAFDGDPARRVGYQRALVAVAYLTGALDAPARGDWVAFRELPGGDAFFRGPHSLATPRLEAAFGAAPARLLGAARALGGGAAEGADAAAVVPALPKVPLKVLLWGAGAEFGASANLLTDGRAHLHAALDVLWALTNVTISDLVEACR